MFVYNHSHSHPKLYRQLDETQAKEIAAGIKYSSCDGRSHYGYKFILWMSSLVNEAEFLQGETLKAYLPPIDIAVKIYSICDISLENRSFQSVFTVMLRWEDPSLALLESTSSEDKVNMEILKDHFVPVYRVQNMQPGDGKEGDQYTPENSGLVRRCSSKSWGIEWTHRLKAVLKVNTDPSLFTCA